jgi:hypothetical protein
MASWNATEAVSKRFLWPGSAVLTKYMPGREPSSAGGK